MDTPGGSKKGRSLSLRSLENEESRETAIAKSSLMAYPATIILPRDSLLLYPTNPLSKGILELLAKFRARVSLSSRGIIKSFL